MGMVKNCIPTEEAKAIFNIDQFYCNIIFLDEIIKSKQILIQKLYCIINNSF
jgi:hypothetical protein